MRRHGVLDLQPKQDNINDPAIILCPGWGEGVLGWSRVARQINKTTGRRVVVIASPGWQFRDLHLLFKDGTSQQRLADNVGEQMVRLRLNGAVGIGHSMSGIYLQMAADDNVHHFSQLILVCPAGFMDHDTFWCLTGRLLKKTWLSLVYAARHPRFLGSTLVAVLEGLLYSLRNPFAIVEALDVAYASTDLARSATIVLANEDIIFPTNRMRIPDHMIVKRVPGQHDLQYDTSEFTDLVASLIADGPSTTSQPRVWLSPTHAGGRPRSRGFGIVESPDGKGGEELDASVNTASPREERRSRRIYE